MTGEEPRDLMQALKESLAVAGCGPPEDQELLDLGQNLLGAFHDREGLVSFHRKDGDWAMVVVVAGGDFEKRLTRLLDEEERWVGTSPDEVDG